jgi:hypothetical protein
MSSSTPRQDGQASVKEKARPLDRAPVRLGRSHLSERIVRGLQSDRRLSRLILFHEERHPLALPLLRFFAEQIHKNLGVEGAQAEIFWRVREVQHVRFLPVMLFILREKRDRV